MRGPARPPLPRSSCSARPTSSGSAVGAASVTPPPSACSPRRARSRPTAAATDCSFFRSRHACASSVRVRPRLWKPQTSRSSSFFPYTRVGSSASACSSANSFAASSTFFPARRTARVLGSTVSSPTRSSPCRRRPSARRSTARTRASSSWYRNGLFRWSSAPRAKLRTRSASAVAAAQHDHRQVGVDPRRQPVRVPDPVEHVQPAAALQRDVEHHEARPPHLDRPDRLPRTRGPGHPEPIRR